MISKKCEKKINRKQKRCQTILAKELDIIFSDSPTNILVICNAGLSTGLKREVLVTEILQFGRVDDVFMIPGKSYCFLKFNDVNDSILVFNHLHGKSKLGQNENVLYLCMVNSESIPSSILLPCIEEYPPGLIIMEEFISEDQETGFLLNLINWNDKSSHEDGKTLKHRQVKHFGYEFIYGSNNVDRNKPLEKKIPKECDNLWIKLKQKLPHLSWFIPDQMTANHYEPGHGIPPHVDTHSAFLDPVLSLSLGSDVVMEFRHLNGKQLSVNIPRRSLLVMSDECRFDWTHGITPRKTDIIKCNTGDGLTINNRKIRVSFTFRKLRNGPCNCIYPNLCDSSKGKKISEINEIELSSNAAKLELESVHKVYDQIGNHFSDTRHSPWPQVEQFIQSLNPGSIMCDIGCGNGKYLSTNEKILKIGCDRSESLLKVCRERGFNVFQSDCLALPFKSATFDACISIAVIHHLASKERRLKAINEMSRILAKDGKALIYVWAKNQKADNKKSSYLRQNKNNGETEILESEEISSIRLPIHTNRTEFKHQDVFVPWKLKSKNNCDDNEEKTFLRFYHVFEQNELEKLCNYCDDKIKIIKSYYDQGNWCVIFQKF